jgi:hypothetical protein
VLAASGAAPSIAVELAIRIVVRVEIAFDRLAPGARGSTARCRLYDDERCLVLLGHLGWRQPGLLQRRVLAEQRLL